MDLKKYIPVIAILSVLIMVAWVTLAGSYEHSWLAVFAGGCLIAVISILNKGKSRNDQQDK